MAEQVLEGLWEEIAQHADQLAGKRVRLTVLSEVADLNENQLLVEERPLSELLEGLIGVIDSSQPTPFPRKRSEWGESLVEKFRKQGLKLP